MFTNEIFEEIIAELPPKAMEYEKKDDKRGTITIFLLHNALLKLMDGSLIFLKNKFIDYDERLFYHALLSAFIRILISKTKPEHVGDFVESNIYCTLMAIKSNFGISPEEYENLADLFIRKIEKAFIKFIDDME